MWIDAAVGILLPVILTAQYQLSGHFSASLGDIFHRAGSSDK